MNANLERRLAWLERRGLGLALFVQRVAERGDVAESEIEDLEILRLEWAALRRRLAGAAS